MFQKLVITAVTIKLPNSTVCFQFLLLFVCFRCAVWHWILVPQSGIKVQNPNHFIAHEVLQESVFSFKTENFLSISPLHSTTSLASSCAIPSVYFTQEHRLLSWCFTDINLFKAIAIWSRSCIIWQSLLEMMQG